MDHSIYVIGDLEGADLDRLERILTHALTLQYVTEMAPKLADAHLDIHSTLVKSISIHGGC